MFRNVLIHHLTRHPNHRVVFQVGNGVHMPIDVVLHDPGSNHIMLGISPDKMLAALEEFEATQSAATPKDDRTPASIRSTRPSRPSALRVAPRARRSPEAEAGSQSG